MRIRNRSWWWTLAVLLVGWPGIALGQTDNPPASTASPAQSTDFLPPAPPPPPGPGVEAPPPAEATKSPVLTDPTKVQAGSFAALAGPMANMFSPLVGNLRNRVTFGFMDYPNQNVLGQPTHLGIAQGNLAVLVPIYQDSRDEWSVNGRVRGDFYDTNAQLLDSKRAFPEELYNIGLGLGYRHRFDNDWIAGVNVSVGSASDKPFQNINVMTAGINAFLRIPSGEHNAWLFSLSYSPTGELWFPVPGVAYLWAPSPQFVAAIGVPFFIMYRPWEDLSLTASYMPLRTVNAQATYRLGKTGARIYVGYSFNNEAWFLADRTNDQDRFFYYDQRVTTGIQINPHPNWVVDVSGGYAFDRFFFQGQSFQDSHNDRVNVGDGMFFSAKATFRW